MSRTKTFADIQNSYTAEQIYPTIVTQADRTTIDDYFHFRHVCDEDEKFLWFFRRSLNRAYPRYQKLVELELSEIPDLVDYRRAIHNEVTGSTSGTDSVETTAENESTLTGNHSDSATTNVEADGTRGGTSTTNRTGTDATATTTDNTTSHTGTDTTAHTGTERTQNESTSDGTSSSTSTTDRTGTDTTAHTSQTSESTTAQEINEQKTSAYHKEISRALPQSTNGATISGANMSLDWTYGSAQGQTEDNGGKTQRDNTNSITGSASGSDTVTHNTEDETVGSATTHGESDSDTTVTHNTQEQTTHNTQEVLDGESSSTTTHNTQDATTDSATTHDESESTTTSSGTQSSTTAGTSSTTSEATKSSSSTTSGDTVESGQSVIETEIREKIRSYIRNSISIDWLRRELEPCFMGVYEV